MKPPEKIAQPSLYVIRQCLNTDCEFRFPAPQNSGIGVHCPKCKTPTGIVREIVLNPDFQPHVNFRPVMDNFEILLDNVRSCFNVGAIFRSADGAGIAKIHLCGITPSPLNPKVHKTALGSESTVPYEIHKNALKAVQALRSQGRRIWALETTDTSEDLSTVRLTRADSPVVLVAGNEVTGIDPAILEICDRQIHIPMSGVKGSLNVAIALGIAVYHLIDFSSYKRERNYPENAHL